jgi:PTH1 family peptidyl-tRNA hydrolase
MSVSHLIIGLGNPGDDYAGTRHNVGFMAVDEIAVCNNNPAWKKKFRGLLATAPSFALLKPMTYMNLSGEAAREALGFYQLKAAQVVVFHDDLDLQPGEVRIKQGGGSGGHNGLKSLDQHIGQDYWRVRIGIGRPMTEPDEDGKRIAVKGDAVSNYVLSPFSKSERKWLAPLIAALGAEARLMLQGKYKDYAAHMPKP